MIAPYEKLRAWQTSHEVVLQVYRATEAWPKREMYGLTAQARRAAFSVAANIAEGVVKRGQREFRRFLDIALGSSTELRYIMRLARDLGYVADAEWDELESARNLAGMLVWRLYVSVAKRAR
jgi:four helix bundle protein